MILFIASFDLDSLLCNRTFLLVIINVLRLTYLVATPLLAGLGVVRLREGFKNDNPKKIKTGCGFLTASIFFFFFSMSSLGIF